MTASKLHGIWWHPLAQWLTDTCPARQTNLIRLIVELYLSGNGHTSTIVRNGPIAAQVASLTRRLSRFLDSGAVRPAIGMQPVARRLLARGQRPLASIVDAIKIGAGQQ